jgi:hypothetical protein
MWGKRLRDHLPSPCRQLTFLPLLVECTVEGCGELRGFGYRS